MIARNSRARKGGKEREKVKGEYRGKEREKMKGSMEE